MLSPHTIATRFHFPNRLSWLSREVVLYGLLILLISWLTFFTYQRVPPITIQAGGDPALVRSAVRNYFLARLAAEHVKVILTGEGADELYAGYAYLRALDEPAALQNELHIRSARCTTRISSAPTGCRWRLGWKRVSHSWMSSRSRWRSTSQRPGSSAPPHGPRKRSCAKPLPIAYR